MKSRIWENSRRLFEFVSEKFMEWLCNLRELAGPKRGTSNLIEEYSIRSKFLNEEFVRTFLNERKRIIELNRYRIRIKEEKEEDGNELEIGKVTLYRNRTYIHEAQLVIKRNDADKIIYWKFGE